MRALVMTVVHHPDDSRIRFREIAALLDDGWDVTYAAPFSGYDVPVPAAAATPAHIDVPRAHGRNRMRAWRGVRNVLEQYGPDHDIIVLHDPELLTTLSGLNLPPVVWDVHEDTAAAVTLKPWLPGMMRSPTRLAFSHFERMAERRVHIILAEYAYRDRFRDEHLVVPNVTSVPYAVPPPDEPRIVYVGSMTAARGAVEMIDTARTVHTKTGGEVRTELIGPASPDVAPHIRKAVDDGFLDWPGVVPSNLAMARIKGSLAGLSLLHDEPNYRVSMPTKVIEYLAHGVPVITSPLPLAEQLVDDAQCGIIVPFNDPAAAAEAVLSLWNDPEKRRTMGGSGHATAARHYDWTAHAHDFTQEMERIARAKRDGDGARSELTRRRTSPVA